MQCVYFGWRVRKIIEGVDSTVFVWGAAKQHDMVGDHE